MTKIKRTHLLSPREPRNALCDVHHVSHKTRFEKASKNTQVIETAVICISYWWSV